MTRPWYPCIWSSKALRKSPKPSAQDLKIFGVHEVDAAVAVFCHMTTVLNVLAKANRYHSAWQDQEDENGARNEVQYRILALPDSAFRISALLFSDMVFFPTPVTTGTREKLAHALQHQLQAEINASTLRLWMATTAATGLAPDSPSRPYFLGLAATQALRLGISDFGSFESELCEVLWDTRVVKADLESV